MKKVRVWLAAAFVLSVCVTVMNAAEGRLVSVLISLFSLAGIAAVFLREKKTGYEIMCAAALLSFFAGSVQGMQEGTGIVTAVVMSLAGSMLIPLVTGIVLRCAHVKLR